MAGKAWTAAIAMAGLIALPSVLVFGFFAILGTLFIPFLAMNVVSANPLAGLEQAEAFFQAIGLMIAGPRGIYGLVQLVIVTLLRLFRDRETLELNRWRLRRGMIVAGWLLVAASLMGVQLIMSPPDAASNISPFDKELKAVLVSGWLLLPLIVMLLIDLQRPSSKRRYAHV